MEWLIRLFRSLRLWTGTRLLPPGGSTLDIGCGRARYLEMLKERGYKVRGTELSAASAPPVDTGIPVDLGDVVRSVPGRASFHGKNARAFVKAFPGRRLSEGEG